MFGQKAKVTTKRNVNGSVIYYTPVFDKPKPVKVVEKDIELLNTFMEDIEKWNSKAIKEYNERKETVLARDDLDVANSLEAADSI
jgi:chromosome segregation ATPase